MSGFRSTSSQSTVAANSSEPLAPLLRLRHELEPVLADVDELVDADDAPGVRARPAADARDERVAAGEPRAARLRLLRHRRLVGHATIGASTPSTSSRSALLSGSRASSAPAETARPRGLGYGVLRLVLIGLVAGLFSALFGVGGGIVIVPLLILLAGFRERPAMATSLAAIGDHGARGRDRCTAFEGQRPGRLRRARRAAGARSGPSRARRSSSASPVRWLTFAFAVLLAVVADLAARLVSATTIVARARCWASRRGVLAGLFGVGGGILFVPALVGLGLGQLDAEATSLLAILPTVAAGVWRQQRLRQRPLAPGPPARRRVDRGRRRRACSIATSISEGVAAQALRPARARRGRASSRARERMLRSA